jgi:hypothetical protein
MKSPIMPLICGVATAVMTAAGLSHWWSIRQFITVMDAEAPVSRVQVLAATVESAPAATDKAVAPPSAPQDAAATVLAAPDAGQKQFFEKLITRMESLQSQNRDLLDQLAETNRDLMKLEFRVDTHSESFRPLPVSEDQPFTNFDNDLGVLPPRAEPVSLPNFE